MNKDFETVPLSDLKLTGVIPKSQSSSETSSTPDPDSVWTGVNQASASFSRLKPHERLSADKIGEELAPDAGIWQLYLDEAKEHDDELVDVRNKNLDMMLLLAALFSAILTAFLIESKNLLQQDPNEVSIGLLLFIAQSQQRMEQGDPQPALAPIQLPEFSAPMSARWINGLWFLSLALSLSAALIAMLAKEWLTAYNTSRPRSAHMYALLRQARLDGLFQWRAVQMMDLLPSMLHLALLLFSFGLILYLSMLDSGIAAVIGIVTGGTFVFYVATTLFGVVYDFCPFITQISKYAHKVLVAYTGRSIIKSGHQSGQEKSPDNSTTDKDLHALIWLADNARDPATGDCSYQALAGLCLKVSEPALASVPQNPAGPLEAKVVTTNMGMTSEGHVDTPKIYQNSNEPSNEYNLVQGLFSSICTRLSQALTHQPRELAACQGINVARYANALPKLLNYLQAYSNQQPIINDFEIREASPPETTAQVAFDALDTIWCNECPSLSPDSYALLTSAELQLTLEAATPHISHIVPTHVTSGAAGPENLPAPHAPSGDHHPAQSHVGIVMNSMEQPSSNQTKPIFELRARYSRALSRTGYLLRYHADGYSPIGTDALIHLLNSVCEIAQCSDLNPISQLSTHQSQSHSGQAPRFEVRAVGTGDYLIVDPNKIGDANGLLVGLLRLLASADVQTNSLNQAAGNALNTVAPILIQQWLSFSRGIEAPGITEMWAQLTNPVWRGRKTDWPARLALAIATIVLPHTGYSGIDQLPERAVFTLCKRIRADPNPCSACYTTCSRQDQIDQLVLCVDQHLPVLNQPTLKCFTNIFFGKYQKQIFLQHPGLSPNLIPHFLRILAKIPDQVQELQTLLAALENQVAKTAEYLVPFIDSEEAFKALLKIGEHDSYRSIVAKCIAGIVQIAANLLYPIQAQAISAFLDATSFALKALMYDKEDTGSLTASIRKLLPWRFLLDNIGYPTAILDATKNLYDTLKTHIEKSEEQETLLVELEGIQNWADIYNLPVGEVLLLFEQNKMGEPVSQIVASPARSEASLLLHNFD